MRTSTVATALSLGLVLAAGARPAHALTDETLKVRVPFAFHVYDTALPAGSYVIKQVDTLVPDLLLIQKDDESASALFLAEAATPKQSLRKTELVFDRYGKARFLHAIWVPYDTGAELLTSQSELKVARAMGRASLEKAQSRTTARASASR